MTTLATKQHNSALAFILAAYAETATPDPETIKAKLALLKPPKPAKHVKVKGGKVVKEAAPGGVAPSATDGIVIGSLDAGGFIAAIRQAGNVAKVLANGETLMVASGEKARIVTDQRAALAAYVGLTAEPLGVQISNATRRAQYALRPTVGSDRRTADPSLSGFVAGMPAPLARQIADLAAREVLAAETMATHEKAARDATDESMRILFEGLAMLESARIDEIRKDLARLV